MTKKAEDITFDMSKITIAEFFSIAEGDDPKKAIALMDKASGGAVMECAFSDMPLISSKWHEAVQERIDLIVIAAEISKRQLGSDFDGE